KEKWPTETSLEGCLNYSSVLKEDRKLIATPSRGRSALLTCLSGAPKRFSSSNEICPTNESKGKRFPERRNTGVKAFLFVCERRKRKINNIKWTAGSSPVRFAND
uniref:Uncharacterized protein n=1 Tax=Anopheles atroparvus TaxID=41427 RepID=A0AAG5CUN6_ANOAO